jgi:hypothetical protein
VLSKSLRAAPDLAVELLQYRVAVLITLLVVAHGAQLLAAQGIDVPGDLVDGQLVVALDGKLARLQASFA